VTSQLCFSPLTATDSNDFLLKLLSDVVRLSFPDFRHFVNSNNLRAGGAGGAGGVAGGGFPNNLRAGGMVLKIE
jgi:hypothetical protein